MSDRAFLQARNLKPAPGIGSLPAVCCTLRTLSPRRSLGSVSKTVEASTCRCAGGLPSLPQGSLARVRVLCLIDQRLLLPHASVSQPRSDSRLGAIRSAFAVRERLGIRETFPTFTAVLSLHAADPTPVVHRAFPLYSHSGSRLPRIISESPTHSARLCQLSPTG